jgi:hypothetical protein
MTPPSTVSPNNAFLEALAELGGGTTQADLHRAMVELVGAVRSVGRAGKLTLTLSIGLAKGSTHTIIVSDDIKVAEPKPDRESTIMFADDANRLSRRDPRQPKLPEMADGKLRGADAEVREFPRIAANSGPGEPTNAE